MDVQVECAIKIILLISLSHRISGVRYFRDRRKILLFEDISMYGDVAQW